jgi:hypothetical protein
MLAVQKASKNGTKKRKANEMAIRGQLSDIMSGTAIASSSSTLTSSAPGEPTIRDTRAAAARGG